MPKCKVTEAPETAVARVGYMLLADLIDAQASAAIAKHWDDTPAGGAGSRNWLSLEWCARLARELRADRRIAVTLPADPVAVQCTAFTKSPDSNWLVGLHQDRSIPVSARVSDIALGGWSEKEGGLFVQPPRAVLEQLTAVRLHVDDCPVDSGPLRVVPMSHDQGLLTATAAQLLRERHGERVIAAHRGSAIIMKPLILHASSKALVPQHRRVLHFVFGPRRLPHGLAWQRAI